MPFKQYLILPFLHQGAGGEPMEISEQVGMTPEIIQKVILIFFFFYWFFFTIMTFVIIAWCF